jgi:NhaA family Na+:H+ antiporter
MATDLPLALAVVAVFGKHLPLSFRAFLLSLAIADDVGSVLVIALGLGAGVSAASIAVAAVGVVAYWILNRRGAAPVVQLAAALGSWFALLHSGLHPTILGVVLGLVTVRHNERLRDFWQPISSGLCVPLFVFTALAIPLAGFELDIDLAEDLSMARIVGKTLGVALGAMLGLLLFRPVSRLPLIQYALAGAVASLGFSVSMLFAQLSVPSQEQLAQIQVAVLVALVVATLFVALVLSLSRFGQSAQHK